MFRIYTFIHDFCLSFCLAWRNKWAFQTMLTIFLWSNAWFSCIDGVAGIMPIITCPSCNSTNVPFCHKKGFVENMLFWRKTGFVANTLLFGFVWCRLLRRHLGFDSDFAQISGLKIGGWQLWFPDTIYTPKECLLSKKGLKEGERVAQGHFHERMVETPVHWLPSGVGITPKPFSVSENGPFENFLRSNSIFI